MSAVDIIIRKDGILLTQPAKGGTTPEISVNAEGPIGKHLADFTGRTGVTAARPEVCIYVAEELLFFKSFDLPLKTPDLNEAVLFQLDLLTPFSEADLLYSFSDARGKEAHHVCLYALEKKRVEPVIEELFAADCNINGLFPLCQRYVPKNAPREKWALVMPDRFAKIFVLEGAHLTDRFICNAPPQAEGLRDIVGTEKIYHLEPPADTTFADGGLLLADKPAHREFNLLPASYRRPDYYRPIILALLALNIIAIFIWAGSDLYSLGRVEKRLAEEIALVRPAVEEVAALRKQEEKLVADINRLEEIGQNPEIIKLLDDLSQKMPKHSYLDQLQWEKKKGSLNIRGYTNEIGDLTEKLQSIGDIKLQSTSKRKDKTYFDIDITLP